MYLETENIENGEEIFQLSSTSKNSVMDVFVSAS